MNEVPDKVFGHVRESDSDEKKHTLLKHWFSLSLLYYC